MSFAPGRNREVAEAHRRVRRHLCPSLRRGWSNLLSLVRSGAVFACLVMGGLTVEVAAQNAADDSTEPATRDTVTEEDAKPAGWAGVDWSRVADRLVARSGDTWLRGYDRTKIRIATEKNGTPTVSILHPLEKDREPVLTFSVPAPEKRLPRDAVARTRTAADRIRVEMDKHAGKVHDFYRWWGERRLLEKDLPAVEYRKPMRFDTEELSKRYSSIFTRLAGIQWLSRVTPNDHAVAEQTARLQWILDDRTGHWVFPNRFINYFWGPDDVHALYWFVDRLKTPPGPEGWKSISAWYVRLGPVAKLGPLVTQALEESLRDSRISGPRSQALGDSFLRPILAQDGFFPTGDASSFSVALAPDGPLCFLPLTQIPFTPVELPQPLRLKDPVEPRRTAMRIPPTGNTGPYPIDRLSWVFHDSANQVCPIALWTFVNFSLSPSGDNRPNRSWEALWKEMMVRRESLAFGRAEDEHRYASFLSLSGTNVRGVRKSLNDLQNSLAELVSNPSGIPTDAGFLFPRLRSKRDTRVIVISDVSMGFE